MAEGPPWRPIAEKKGKAKPERKSSAAGAEKKPAEQGPEKKAPPPLDWRVFRVRSVQVCLFNHCESSAPLPPS